jgi:hypothetical protein
MVTKNMTRKLGLASAFLIMLAGLSQAQTASPVAGRWQWKERAVKNKSQRQFTLVISGKGKTVRGTYSVDEFINGKWQGEDGNQTPFRGEVEVKVIRIEFDPMATAPGYEQDVTYKPPADGRKPSVAFLSFSRGTLLWRFVSGERIAGVPGRITLTRERRRN